MNYKLGSLDSFEASDFEDLQGDTDEAKEKRQRLADALTEILHYIDSIESRISDQ